MSLGREINDFIAAFNGTARTMGYLQDAQARREEREARKRAIDAKNPDKFPTVVDAAKTYKQQYGAAPPAMSPAGALDVSPPTPDTGYFAGGGLVEQAPPTIYDEQGNPISQGGGEVTSEGTGALPVASGPPVQLHAQPAPSLRREVPYNPSAGGEGSSASASDDYARALDGGLRYAKQLFHLDGDGAALPGTDPHQQRGKEAFAKGVGAAPPEQVAQLDKAVNQHPGVPPDPSIWAIRRLEAIYRWYSMNGETEKANKAAFELIQFSAGAAAQYGQQALAALKQGDQQGAVNAVAAGYNQIPDGRRVQVSGPGQATIVDARTGKPVQQLQFTPQQLFNAALGLADRSLYWDVLMNRAAMATSRGSARTQSQQDLDRARARYYDARTANVGRGRGGGGGGVDPAAAKILERLNAIREGRGKAPVTPEEAAPPGGGGQGDAGEPDNDEDDAPGVAPANAGGEGGGEGGRAPATGQQPSPAGTAFDPEGNGYDEQMAREAGLAPDDTGHWPSRDPRTGVLLKGRQHPTWDKTVAEEEKRGYYVRKREDGRYESHNPDEVPERVFARNGSKYEPPAEAEKPRPFGEQKPDNMERLTELKALRVEAAKLAPKSRTGVMKVLDAEIRDLENEVKDWDKRRKEHVTGERTRYTTETKAARDAQRERMREAYDRKLKPEEVKNLRTEVEGAYKTLLDVAKGESDQLTPEQAAKNKEMFPKTFWADEKIKPETFQDLTISIATSNENMDAAKATRVVSHLLMAGPAGERSYTVQGKDPLGNVILLDKRYGPVHVRPVDYKTITQLVRQREKDLAAMDKKAEEAKVKRDKPRPTPSWLRDQPGDEALVHDPTMEQGTGSEDRYTPRAIDVAPRPKPAPLRRAPDTEGMEPVDEAGNMLLNAVRRFGRGNPGLPAMPLRTPR